MDDKAYLAPDEVCGDALIREAREFLHLYAREQATPDHVPGRLAEIVAEVKSTGTYWQTPAELAHGARVAWRNSNRCVGRLFWRTLKVVDLRHLETPDEIFAACVQHLRTATNGGKIQPLMTVFAPKPPGQPGIRIWNPQLIRYAGYRNADGTITGDPAQLAFTRLVQELGWTGPGTAFDVLPLVIDVPGYPLRLYELPTDAVLEVPIRHPQFPWFAELGLRWHAVPVISNMRFVCGGIHYPAAPFSGWYMGTEIGARNFGDPHRYNLLPTVANRMGLDTRSNRTLWKDRALVELNVAVLHSFAQAGVTIVDHHTATQQFMKHQELEARAGRETTGDWAWLVPPISGSATPVFHTLFDNTVLKPNFYYQPMPWSVPAAAAGPADPATQP